jgi:2-hydroxy-6-oxonona-2,4-dienedioate hydrolase
MKLFDAGAGPSIVVVPGVTGRWEWLTPALESLSQYGRTISYSLCGDPGSGWPFPAGAPFDTHVAQLEAVLDKTGVRRALLCGVSFGGWVALRYAARYPSRVSGLVLSSAPGPAFRPDPRQARYVRAPLLLAPLFVAAARGRLRGEIVAAIPEPAARRAFTRQQLSRIMRAPMSPRLMARRFRSALREDFAGDCENVQVPTLVLTGEPHLDRVVPAGSTCEYLRRIGGSRHAVLAGTGHLGLVTRPAEWARTIAEFAHGARGEASLSELRMP